ncbi:MAG: phosphoribosylglycinamide formyltransferase [Firmicutes bacterium]|nr:phosphoribosylglycinamide formyltransferase [Bacillota bacterium]
MTTSTASAPARSDDRVRIAVLASGTGSNFRNLVECSRAGGLAGGEVVCLVSDRPDCGAARWADDQGIASWRATHKSLGGRDAWEAQAVGYLREQRIDLIVLAGYMRVVGAALLLPWEGRMINIHPSLLPAFPGLHAPAQALAAGVSETGVTVHFVDSGMDTGPILAQRSVPVFPSDSLTTLTARIHEVEHALLPSVVGQLCARYQHSVNESI